MNLDYRIIHSNRRTVSLVINRDGSLVVRAPKKASKAEIEKIIESKKAWIEKHLRKINLSKPAKKKFADGETFLLLGQNIPLRIIDAYRSRLVCEDNRLQLSRFKLHSARKLFIDWYVKQAAQIIFERARYYAEIMGVKYRRISITSAQTRWGSCSSQGTINFSWRLVLAPLNIIDSVVVHELAHLIHHNHSRQFWHKVSEHCPDYKQAKQWLKTHSHLLQI